MDEIEKSIAVRFNKVLEVVRLDMATIRVGGAKASMVSDIVAEVYGGQRMKLLELCNITVPDPTQILITPWDRGVVRDIEKAILNSDVKLMPNVNGEMIRIIVPPLTEERRRDFVKLLKMKLESGKVLLRQARQEIKEEVEKMVKGGGVSEDEEKRVIENLDKQTADFNKKLDEMALEKEEEIMTI